jgi:hypothetical protein
LVTISSSLFLEAKGSADLNLKIIPGALALISVPKNKNE